MSMGRFEMCKSGVGQMCRTLCMAQTPHVEFEELMGQRAASKGSGLSLILAVCCADDLCLNLY